MSSENIIYDICNSKIKSKENDKNYLQYPEEFLNYVNIYKIDDDYEFIEATISENILIFRGDRVISAKHNENVPIFLSDVESSLIYTRDNDMDKLSAFKIIKKPKLFLLCNSNLLLLKNFINNEDSSLSIIFSDEEKSTINLYYNDSKINENYTGPHIYPAGFLHKSDALLEYPLYLNRRMIDIICKLGYDGWVSLLGMRNNPKYVNDNSMKNITLVQKNLDTKHYLKDVNYPDELTNDIKKDAVIFTDNEYYPELALKNWTKFVVEIDSPR